MNLLDALMAKADAAAASAAKAPPVAVARDATETPRGEALAMLSQVLSQLADIGRPIVQIMPASAGCGAGQVAFELAVAAALHFGTTLLVSDSEPPAPDLTGARALSWRMTRLLGDSADALTPDGVVNGLYHAQPALDDAHGAQAASLKSWLAAPQDFRMVVFDSPALAICPQTLGTAALCHTCVLTVRAGQTRAEELRTAERQLASAGVCVAGVVLHGAPDLSLRPRRRGWRR